MFNKISLARYPDYGYFSTASSLNIKEGAMLLLPLFHLYAHKLRK
jgi:hypothetical protein